MDCMLARNAISIQARIGSSRLPAKIFLTLQNNFSVLQNCVNRAIKISKELNLEKPIIVCPKDDEALIVDHLKDFFKDIFIFGGGDSALDWTIDLAEKAKSLSLVHRRDAFRGALHSEEKMRELVASGKVKLLTPYLIDSIKGSEKVEGVTLKNFDTNEIEHHTADELLFLFGLNKKLGPILEWNLDLSGKKISVNTENYQTSVEGIFAVGDINDYPGKLDLILSGFHETTLAVQEAYKRIYPGERVPFGYTTSNSKLQEKLGVKEK